jgi:hypothetical protein
MNDIGVDLLLDKSWSLNYALHAGWCRLVDMPLNVVDNVVIHRAVENGLHLYDSIIADSLLNDGRTITIY